MVNLIHMKMNCLAAAVALTDRELLARMPGLAAQERAATAELVAHLAALRLRPSLYTAEGYGSLFAYCRSALRLSEDAASNRIHAAKACLQFPLVLDLLVSGDLSLSAVRMLRPHLTMENHERVLARARNARRVDIERLVAELAPRAGVPSSVRKLPGPSPAERRPAVGGQGTLPAAEDIVPVSPTATPITAERRPAENGSAAREVESDLRPAVQLDATPPAHAFTPRPVVQPLSPQRYRVQFTVGQDTYDILRRLQTLLRRELPDGDAGAIFERGLRLLHETVEAARFGRPKSKERGYETRIRPGADPSARSRYVPRAVKRAVWCRDRGQCAFVSASGRRCDEREFLELHHLQPYALRGPSTAANLALRWRGHNAYEAEAVFGSRALPPPGPRRRGSPLMSENDFSSTSG